MIVKTTDAEEFRSVRDDAAELLKTAENARQHRLHWLRELIANGEQRLVKIEEEKRNILESNPKFCAELARTEAMTAADIVREVLPDPEPKPQTVAEHVEKPGMYAIWHTPTRSWLRKNDPGVTDYADQARHVNHMGAWDLCAKFWDLQAYSLDDLHTVDGLLKIKPGAKPVRFDGAR